MDADSPTLWGIHAGKTGDADTLFLKRGVIALGWTEMPTLASLADDREAFKALVAERYPDKTTMQVANNAGQLYRFVHELKQNDLVAYPSKRDRRIHVGRVTGGYTHDLESEPGYPHRRPVDWLRDFPRTRFSQGALAEIGSAMSFFQVKNYADEYFAALTDKSVTAAADQGDEVARDAQEIEQSTRDFVYKRLARELKGHPFADFVAHLLNVMGYRTRVSPAGPDGGVDIVAYKDALGLEPPIVRVQVKSEEKQISNAEVSQLFGHVGPGEYGLFVALGGFKKSALQFASGKASLRLRIPVESGHRFRWEVGHPFRAKSATDSGGNPATFGALPEQVAGLCRNDRQPPLPVATLDIPITSPPRKLGPSAFPTKEVPTWLLPGYPCARSKKCSDSFTRPG